MKKILIIIFIFLSFPEKALTNQIDQLYKKLDLFSDVLETLNKQYVDEVDQNKVLDSAINGMLQSLHP